jgi:uncharacterized protein
LLNYSSILIGSKIMVNHKQVVDRTRSFVKSKLEGEGSGHDWWHVVRVVENAKTIAAQEGGDLFVIELAALLHDIADWKFHDGDSTIGAKISQEWLLDLEVSKDIAEHAAYIVEHISFKGGTNRHIMRTLEGKIVQDADRLDALGAIGIARAFAYGGSVGRLLYDPGSQPTMLTSFDSYKKVQNGTTINHFYEKLLLLKDRMNTKTGKAMALNRHKFMEKYLEQFYAEWSGER